MKNLDFYLNKAIKILMVINICIMLTILSFFFTPSVFADSISSFIPYYYGNSTVGSNNVSSVISTIDNGFYLVYDVYDLLDDSKELVISGSFDLIVSSSGYNKHLSVYLAPLDSLNSVLSGSSTNYVAQSGSTPVGTYSIDVDKTITVPEGYYLVFYSYGASSDISNLSFNISSSPSDLPDYNGLRIPTGHYARIEFQNNSGSLTLNTTMSVPSNTFGTPWPNSSQQWLSTGISSAESFGNSSKIDIVWSKGGKPSIFGTTYDAVASLSSSNQYIWIYNPIQMNPIFITDGTYYPPNDVITITDLVNVKSVRIYSVTASIFGPATTSDSVYGDSYITSDGAIGWVNQNGDPYTPSNGGGNSQSTDSDSVIQQFRSILSDLVGRIESLLVAPVEYIQRIINAGSTFFSWLAGLWSWLPPAVSGILTSVLYIMAVVGALKLLWR